MNTFGYQEPTSVAKATSSAAANPEARYLAGGQSLLAAMKLGLATPSELVDLGHVPELRGIKVEANGAAITIAAMTRHAEVAGSLEVGARIPALAALAGGIGDRQVRNRGTLGGSLCQADPSEDLTAVCTTLDASCVIRGAAGERVVSMADFHRGPYETAVEHGEILTEIRIPVRPNGSSAYAKVERRAGDWAVTSAGAAVWMDGPVITDARVGLAAVGPNTSGIPAVSEALRGQQPTEELYARAGAIAAESCSPATDNRGTADYKRHLADELTRRTLRTSVERIQAGVAGDQAGDPGRNR